MEDFFNSYSGTITAISGIVSIIALLIAYLALKDQIRSKFTVEALPMIASNNDRYFGYQPNARLKISNRGNKAITICDITLCVGRERFPMPQTSFEKINIYIEPGQVEYYTYERNFVIELVTNTKHKKDYVVCWELTSNDGKRARCKTENRVSDFINVNMRR